MPLGLGTSIVFIYNKLFADSELIIMRSAGLSSFDLVRPALILAAAVAILCATMTLWLTPVANRNLVTLQYKMRNSFAALLSRPGSFNDLSEGLTFYANKRGQGGSLQGVLIQDVRDPEKTITTMASTGQVIEGEDSPRMVIFNGRRQEFDRATGKLSELAFDQYVLDLEALKNTSSRRFPDPRELSVSELLNPSPQLVRARGPLSRFSGELHARLATPFLSLAYAAIALAAVLAGSFNRRGITRRILVAALAIIILQAVFMTANGLVARNNNLAFVLYAVAILPTPLSLLFLFGEVLPRRFLPRFLRGVLS